MRHRDRRESGLRDMGRWLRASGTRNGEQHPLANLIERPDTDEKVLQSCYSCAMVLWT